MHLTPKEQDKLLLLSMGLIAERRLKKGLKLNYPEAVAYITSAALEGPAKARPLKRSCTTPPRSLPKSRSWTAWPT